MSTAVARAIDVIEAVAQGEDGRRAAEIARSLGLPRSSVWGIVRTLHARGVLEQDPGSRRYTLGSWLIGVADRAGRAPVLRRIARPYLVQLGQETGELAFLAVVHEEHVLYLDKAESRHPIQYIAAIGTRRPLHCTATGKLYLSLLPEADAVALAKRHSLIPVTRSTITDVAGLRRELGLIRSRGYAVSREELLEGVIGIAAPIVAGPGRRMVGALVVAALVERVGDREESLARMVVRMAGLVSRALPRSERALNTLPGRYHR